MSSFTVIGDLGETLIKLLDDDAWDGMDPASKPEITLKSPKEVAEEGTSNNKVSLFLYHIQVNPYLRNEEPPITNDTAVILPPLVVDLFYMITPYSDDKTDEKLILGKVMQIFHDNATLKGSLLQGGLSGTDEAFRLLLCTINLEDLARVWDAFQDVAYRLSVVYTIPGVYIDSTSTLEVQRVLSRKTHSGHMVEQ
jgi:hypothetical protein